MSQLTQTIARDLKKDKEWILSIISLTKKMGTTVRLSAEQGEILITLLMKEKEIEKDLKEAVKEVFGEKLSVSDISLTCGSSVINFTLTSNC